MNKHSSIHFDISERKILLRFMDIASVLSLLYFMDAFFDFDYLKINLENWKWTAVLVGYLTIFATVFELYDLQKASKFESIVQNIILTSSLTVLVYLLTPFLTPTLPENRLQIVYFYISINVALFIWRYAYITLISATRFFKRVILIGNASDIDEIVMTLQKSDPNYKVVGFINTSSDAYISKKFKELIEVEVASIESTVTQHSISEIVVAAPAAGKITATLYNKLILLLENGTPIRSYTEVYEEISHRIPIQYVDKDFYLHFPFSRSNQNKLYLFITRILDLLFSILGLAVGLMIFPIILVGNFCANRGPLLYSQMRVGINGKEFKIYKLRSMVRNAEKDGPQFADVLDTRVTKFGRFLRKSRLDEIPQFINVIKGDMSVIGPRPERPFFVKEFSNEVPFYEVRHLIRPGITGWAQVNARYGSSEQDSLEKLQYDLYYMKHRSLALDINILIKTLSTVIFYRGQ